jgi:hypothetical protein
MKYLVLILLLITVEASAFECKDFVTEILREYSAGTYDKPKVAKEIAQDGVVWFGKLNDGLFLGVFKAENGILYIQKEFRRKSLPTETEYISLDHNCRVTKVERQGKAPPFTVTSAYCDELALSRKSGKFDQFKEIANRKFATDFHRNSDGTSSVDRGVKVCDKYSFATALIPESKKPTMNGATN